MKYRTYVLLVVLVSFLFLEIVVRVTGKQKTYTESIGQTYASYYNIIRPTWYHTWTPGDSFTLDHGDFRFPYKINSLGLRENEPERSRPDSVFRIITFGDSYTEGVGAPYDSTWPRLLEKYLVAPHTIEVINAGESGSDPFYDYTLYRDKLSPYSHQLVIAAFNSSDFADYALRGGLNRFKNDSTTAFKKGPWYEPLYKYSHFFRAVLNKAKHFPYKGIFVTEEELGTIKKESVLQYAAMYDSLNRVATSKSAELIVVFYPTPTEIVNDSEQNQQTKNAMSAMATQLNSKNIMSINLWQDFKKTFGPKPELSYTYVHDKHFNAYGYHLMAKMIADTIYTRNMLRF